MQRDRLGHLPADAVQRVEAGHRLLEHDAGQRRRAHCAAASGAAPIICCPSSRMRAGRIAAAVRQQLQQRQRRHRLAGAGLAHQRQGLAAIERERHVVDHARLAPKRDGQIVRPRARLIRCRQPCCGSKASRTASPMKISSVSIAAQHDERGDAEPGRLQIVLALRHQFAERRRSRRQAEAQEIEASPGSSPSPTAMNGR